MKTNFKLVSGMIAVATASMFIPHPPNFSPMAAIALFAGARFADKRIALAVPLIAVFLSDLVTGLHVLISFVYGSYALTVGLGMLLRVRPGAARTGGAALLSAILFFLITNFGVWAMLDTFPKTAVGLLACYAAGLAHFQNTILSNLLYSLLLFGGYALAAPRLAPSAPALSH